MCVSYQDYLRIKAWKQKQELIQEVRAALRPLADQLAAIPDPLDLDNLQVLDLAAIPDPLGGESE